MTDNIQNNDSTYETLNDAYRMGYNDHWAALWHDEDGHNNPYPPDSAEWQAYENGYAEAGQDW